MFHKIRNAIHVLNVHHGFDGYIARLYSRGNYSGPTADEAKKDYRNYMHSQTIN